MNKLTTILLVALMATPAPVLAGNCGSFFCRQQVVHKANVVEKVLVEKQVFSGYAVGYEHQYSAISAIAAEVSRATAREEVYRQKYEEAMNQLQRLQGGPPAPPPPGSENDPRYQNGSGYVPPGFDGSARLAPASVIVQKCGTCHGGNNPKGGVFLGEGVDSIFDGDFRRSMEMLAGEGPPPPPEMLNVIEAIQKDQQAQGAIMQEMLRLRRIEGPAAAVESAE